MTQRNAVEVRIEQQPLPAGPIRVDGSNLAKVRAAYEAAGREIYKPDDVLRVKVRRVTAIEREIVYLHYLRALRPNALNPNLIFVTENGRTEVLERVK